MSRVVVARDATGSLAAARRLWLDTERWASWVDGLDHVIRRDPSWPEPGAAVEWESHPGGRGRVTERITDAAPDTITTEVSDGRLAAVQTVRLEQLDGGAGVELELRYTLLGGGPARRIVDFLFIRRALADSLRRTLERFCAELEDDYKLAQSP